MVVPGSIMKVHSTSIALDSYGPDDRFHTPVYWLGAVSDMEPIVLGPPLKGDRWLIAGAVCTILGAIASLPMPTVRG
jgi:hypothetical protein